METIKSKKEIENIFVSGSRFHTKLCMIIVRDTPKERDQYGRVAFIAGKKLGNAPFRSRCKRVMREMVRTGKHTWPHKDVVFIARAAIHDASPLYLQAEYTKVLQRADLPT